MSITLDKQSAKQWLTDGKAYNHPLHGLVTTALLRDIVLKEIKKPLPAEITDYLARAYLNGTPIGMAKRVALEEMQQTFMTWMYSLSHDLKARDGMDTPELRANGMRALLEHEHLRIYEVRMLLRMIASGLIRPKMDTRFIAADLVECVQIYLERRTKAVAEFNRKKAPCVQHELLELEQPANIKQGEATIQKLIERLDLEPVSPSLRAKWMQGGTLTDHERQQIRKEAASQTKGQAQGQGSDSTPEEDARTAQSQGR